MYGRRGFFYRIKSIIEEVIMTEELLAVYRHSLAHILAKAVIEIFGKENVQYAIGPQIADGLYYDFVLPRTITEDDYKVIEDKMNEIIKRKEDWVCKEISKEEGLELFADQKFKKELYTIISNHSHTPYEKVWQDSDRNYWMTAEEAKEYGMIDQVLVKKG